MTEAIWKASTKNPSKRPIQLVGGRVASITRICQGLVRTTPMTDHEKTNNNRKRYDTREHNGNNIQQHFKETIAFYSFLNKFFPAFSWISRKNSVFLLCLLSRLILKIYIYIFKFYIYMMFLILSYPKLWKSLYLFYIYQSDILVDLSQYHTHNATQDVFLKCIMALLNSL